MKQKPRREMFECPNCGADVLVGSAACKECGSDAQTGWQDGEERAYQEVDLPEGWSEDPEHAGGAVPVRRPTWWAVAIVLVTVLGLLLWSILR